jgi:cytochrome c2
MWNHAPVMWAAMDGAGIERPKLSPEAAADLFAFFYSTRFFDKPGDAARGRQVFSAKHCGECHGIAESLAEGAPPVVKWESLGQPMVLVEQMWNHSGRMREAFGRKKISWQQLTTQELTDLLVYLRELPRPRSWFRVFPTLPEKAGRFFSNPRAASNVIPAIWRSRIASTI